MSSRNWCQISVLIHQVLKERNVSTIWECGSTFVGWTEPSAGVCDVWVGGNEAAYGEILLFKSVTSEFIIMLQEPAIVPWSRSSHRRHAVCTLKDTWYTLLMWPDTSTTLRWRMDHNAVKERNIVAEKNWGRETLRKRNIEEEKHWGREMLRERNIEVPVPDVILLFT